MNRAEVAKPIQMLLETDSWGQRNHVLDVSTHWRHLANAMDVSVRLRRCGLSLELL